MCMRDTQTHVQVDRCQRQGHSRNLQSLLSASNYHTSPLRRERGREGRGEREKERERKGGREGRRERGKEGGKREGGREGGRE